MRMNYPTWAKIATRILGFFFPLFENTHLSTHPSLHIMPFGKKTTKKINPWLAYISTHREEVKSKLMDAGEPHGAAAVMKECAVGYNAAKNAAAEESK